MDATIPNPARIAAFAEAACELELPTCIEVGPAIKKKKEKKLNVYVLYAYSDATYSSVATPGPIQV